MKNGAALCRQYSGRGAGGDFNAASVMKLRTGDTFPNDAPVLANQITLFPLSVYNVNDELVAVFGCFLIDSFVVVILGYRGHNS